MSMIDPQPCPPSDGPEVDSCAAPSLAASGLCLSDGTPVAVLFGQDPITCGEDPGDPEAIGWVDLLTGSFTAGAVPAGAKSCGESRDFELGQWCDLDDDGEVIASVLVEYEYDEDTGAVVGTRILTPAGDPYTIVGTLGSCPTRLGPDFEIEVLCDVDDDGVGVPFLRRYRFDGVTEAVTTVDTELDGVSDYAIVGTAGICPEVGVDVELFPICIVSTETNSVVDRVLLEIIYDTVTGERISQRTVDPQTGGSFPMPGGTILTECPDVDIELVQLCDVDDEGNSTPFLRRFTHRDGTPPAIFDLTLDGAPYGPIGEVGVCEPECTWEPVCYRSPSEDVTCTNLAIVDSPGANFTSAVVAENPRGFSVGYLDRTFDGNTSSGPPGGHGIIDSGNDLTNTQVAIDYMLSTPRDRVTHFRLWNQFGSNVTDFDGIGAATLTLFDASDNVLFTGPLVADNGGVPFDTPVGGPLDGVVRARLSDITANPGGSAPDIGWREVALVSTYEAILTTTCGTVQATAVVTGLNPGLSYANGQLTQTSGPHDLTFTLPTGTGTIVTDSPTSFSSLTFTNGSTVTVTGNGTMSFALSVEGTESLSTGFACVSEDGSSVEVISSDGAPVPDAVIEPCIQPNFQHQVTLCDEAGPFQRKYIEDASGAVLAVIDLTLAGAPYVAVGEVTTCSPDECISHIQLLRLCDLDPDVEPDDQGRRCAVPFLRWLTFDCDGEITDTRDTEADGETPYTPTEVVDCDGGTPSLVEVPWIVTDIADGDDNALIFTLSPEDDPSQVGTVTVRAGAPSVFCGTDVDEGVYAFSNPRTYIFELDAVAQQMSYLRADLLDFDGFEPTTIPAGYPAPDRLGGTAYWDGNVIRPTHDNDTGEMYWDNPPATVAWRVGNTGGGNSCSQLSFGGMTLRAEGTCDDTPEPPEPCEYETCDVIELCDVDAEGASTPFLRHICRACDGTVSTFDTALDGTTDYEPVGEVGVCSNAEENSEPLFDVERTHLCVFNAMGTQLTRVNQVGVYDARTGDWVSSRLEELDGTPYTLPADTYLGTCRPPQVLDQPVYTGSWSTNDTTPVGSRDLKAEYPGLQSVTVINTSTAGVIFIDTHVGRSELPPGASATWSVTDDDDSSLSAFNVDRIEPTRNVFVAFTYKATANG